MPPTAASSSLAEPDEARSCSRNELKPTSSFGDDRDRCETGHGLMLNANHRLVVVDQARTRPPSWTACSTPELSMQHDQAARPDAAWSRRPKVIRADHPAQTAAMPKGPPAEVSRRRGATARAWAGAIVGHRR